MEYDKRKLSTGILFQYSLNMTQIRNITKLPVPLEIVIFHYGNISRRHEMLYNIQDLGSTEMIILTVQIDPEWE